MEPISPELVLVDPELRARLAHLPSGPVYWPRPRVPAEAEPQPAPPPRPLLGRVVATASVILVFLALPLLAIASDLVRSQPHLTPVKTVPSGGVQVGAQQQVGPHSLRLQMRELHRGR